MKSNQKGFSVVEILVVLVIVGLLGAVGWLVYDRQKSKTDSQQTTTQTSEQKQEPEAYKRTTTVPSDWKTYANGKYKINLSYPSDWAVSDTTMNKEAGNDAQNVYSVNATAIFVLCYKSSDAEQWCPAQLDINNQPFQQSISQLREYYQSNASSTPYTETPLTIDGHQAVEFRTSAKGSLPAQKNIW